MLQLPLGHLLLLETKCLGFNREVDQAWACGWRELEWDPHGKLGPLKGYRLSERGPRKIYPPGKEDYKFSVLAQAVRGEAWGECQAPLRVYYLPFQWFWKTNTYYLCGLGSPKSISVVTGCNAPGATGGNKCKTFQEEHLSTRLYKTCKDKPPTENELTIQN